MRIAILVVLACCRFLDASGQQSDAAWQRYAPIIRKHIFASYNGMYREGGGALKYPFITPGSEAYADVLWDWDSWLSNVALRQVLLENGTEKDKRQALKYEQGCVLNFLAVASGDGWMPILLGRKADVTKIKPQNFYETNMHKPCLAQHAAFITKASNGNADWLKDRFYYLQAFLNNYRNHHRHKLTGLYYWQNDVGIGVDNDPATYARPPRSSASIYLNTMMYKELKAMVYLCQQLNLNEVGAEFDQDAAALYAAIQRHCWDEKDGFFYSVDLNIVPYKEEAGRSLHSGNPRDWEGLIQRLGVWSGFMALWAGVATQEQAARMVAENYADPRTFNAPYGVRTLSRLEKMYSLKATGNPSSWLGPVWGVSNYLTWRGLVDYGFDKEATDLAIKTVLLFGQDFEKNGALHEYYQPENGEPILNKGFQNWNFLVLNMLAWLEEKPVVKEF
ncbi:MGH1-like glycoside hydrolase domain-containing protein [Hymenobacter sp.]|uniref:MGH1-like glycoside hydrolase domain-containing protein n=1 Tax=Hymenobacter sp. TaxID=1898978 RepID=UPI00286B4D33|nr:trehalase family glycosidase [Hymenobacter sp.]